MDQVRGGGGCGFSDQSGGGSGSLSRNFTAPKRANEAADRSILKSWKHLVRQNSGGQALPLAQRGQSSVLDAPFIMEAQSPIGAAAETTLCSPTPLCATLNCTPASFATVAQAEAIGARTIAAATSADNIVRSAGKSWNLQRAISKLALEWSRQINVRGAAPDNCVIRIPVGRGRIFDRLSTLARTENGSQQARLRQ
jgi:hypothetical protein